MSSTALVFLFGIRCCTKPWRILPRPRQARRSGPSFRVYRSASDRSPSARNTNFHGGSNQWDAIRRALVGAALATHGDVAYGLILKAFGPEPWIKT